MYKAYKQHCHMYILIFSGNIWSHCKAIFLQRKQKSEVYDVTIDWGYVLEYMQYKDLKVHLLLILVSLYMILKHS